MKKNKIERSEIVIISLGITLIVALLFLLKFEKETVANPTILSVFFSILVPLAIWLGCREIVTYLWRKHPWEKNPIKHLVIEVTIIPLWAILVMIIAKKIYDFFCNYTESAEEWAQSLFISILITLLITSIHEGFYFYRQWKDNFNLSLKLRKDNLEARYETLKAQLNPHFLFNSLNTLITYVDDNPKASEYIQNLSDFLRYVLANRDKELILIKDEVDSCNKYMFLQKSRFGNNLNWEINLNDNTKNMFIAPLTIQMLLENAIKHNIISKDKKLMIKIGQVDHDFIFVENNLQKKLSESSTGIGLKNIFDRYEYFTSLKPRVEETIEFYKVYIPLIKAEL
jgi:two-component system LytT family sensor kinase